MYLPRLAPLAPRSVAALAVSVTPSPARPHPRALLRRVQAAAALALILGVEQLRAAMDGTHEHPLVKVSTCVGGPHKLWNCVLPLLAADAPQVHTCTRPLSSAYIGPYTGPCLAPI